jgi:hypothetical protein
MPMRDPWTVEDLSALGLEDWFRYEIVDGGLLVSPWAGGFHELLSAEMRAAMWSAQPDGLLVVGPIGVTIGRSYLIPDLVSPDSTTLDRVVKPAKYAAAGIPAHWRVETDPVGLTVYTLTPGAEV